MGFGIYTFMKIIIIGFVCSVVVLISKFYSGLFVTFFLFFFE